MNKIVFKLGILLIFILNTGNTDAVPAKHTKITSIQPDGITITVSQRGDEHFHYFISDDDGLPLVKDKDGYYYHAIIDNDGIKASKILAHNSSQRSIKEREFIAERGNIDNIIDGIRLKRQKQRTITRTTSNDAKAGMRYEGNKKGLVILVNFQDNTFSIPNPKKYYERLLNERGFSDNDCNGSVSQYFNDQSNGIFNLTFDVAGPYTLQNNMEYYGGNNENGDDKNARGMIKEACRMAENDVNFADYDWYNNGYVDLVFVVYAGYCESQGGAPETIWPHQWNLGWSSVTIDGKKIDVYACTGELAGDKGVIPDGIGTFCHEFSHCLGLPDLYNTVGGEVFGMDKWSIMDYGLYLGKRKNGECPCNYTAYERWLCGWSAPTELKEQTSINDMTSLSSGNEGYIIYNDGHKDEYYILENRQKEGWDAYLPGHGLLITHVDYSYNAWIANTVNNNPDHQRCTIIPADNKLDAGSLNGDPFPGTRKNTNLTDTSTPAAEVFNANTDGTFFMNKPITEITETDDGLIAFEFMKEMTNGIRPTTINSEYEMLPDNYRQLLPRRVKLMKNDRKTIKIIEK